MQDRANADEDTVVAVAVLVDAAAQAPAERISALEAAGVEVMRAGKGAQVDLRALMQMLGQRELCSVFVEGGGSVNFSLLEAGLVDKVYAFIAPKIIGGSEALTPVEGAGFAAQIGRAHF